MSYNQLGTTIRYVSACLLAMAIYVSPAFCQRYLEEVIPYRHTATIRIDEGFIEVRFTRKEYIGKADPQRTYYSYYRDSIYTTQGGYHGYPLHGRYIERYGHKGLKVLGQYRYGLRVGKWQYWDEEGILRKVSHWKEGRETGRFAIYDEAGNLQQREGWLVGIRDRLRKWFK
ncbi:toxin-antitoxin system YwqK family antitoxin [Parapedobacter sp. 10938]|uniref:toxin-antitoxin system YwqK family antitoxin n=1 Tax=Parapedobacter flavus TaxID=3110225 RepID=UPI002DB79EAC|nr:hypothetical protein [Parapedobacter sp. 10938]MEC3882035.1 hypothetical protein [Parapedobacter sp. 10938]